MRRQRRRAPGTRRIALFPVVMVTFAAVIVAAVVHGDRIGQFGPGLFLPRTVVLQPGLSEPPTAADPQEEVACLALNIYFEARSEPEIGKLAVGHVVMNRALDAQFPDTACQVVRQGGETVRHRCQFSWWCDGLSDQPSDGTAWAASNRIADLVYWDRAADPTGGALWYHADYVKPAWRKSLAKGPKLGRHLFYYRDDGADWLAAVEDID